MLWIIVLVVVIFLFFKLRKKSSPSSKNNNFTQESVHTDISSSPLPGVKEKSHLTPTSSTITDSTSIAQETSGDHSSSPASCNFATASLCQLTSLYLGGYQSPSGGYENYADFQIEGYILNEKTGRKNKFSKRVTAKSEEDAFEISKTFNIIDHPNILVIPVEQPTERQLEYAADLGAAVPNDAGKQDVSAIISRFVGPCGDRYYENPQPSPNEDFAEFADHMGVHFSKFIGEDDLFSKVVHSLSGKDRAAFWAYSLLCGHSGIEIKNMMNDSDMYAKLCAFSEFAVTDPSIMQSIDARSENDYKRPHKGSKAYKAVAEYFSI